MLLSIIDIFAARNSKNYLESGHLGLLHTPDLQLHEERTLTEILNAFITIVLLTELLQMVTYNRN